MKLTKSDFDTPLEKKTPEELQRGILFQLQHGDDGVADEGVRLAQEALDAKLAKAPQE